MLWHYKCYYCITNTLTMKKHYFLLITASLVFISCSKDFYFKRDQVALSKEMSEIADIDQAVRKYNVIVQQRFGIRTASSVWDSLQTIGKPMNTVNVSSLPYERDQVAKLSPEYRKKYLEAAKAGDDLMEYTSQQHRDQLYRMIKKYGYPSYDVRPWANDSVRNGVGFVLTHFEYSDEKGLKFLNLMLKEYKKGRIAESEMQYFLWHVNWRIGRPDDIKPKEWIADYKKNGLPPFKPF